MAPDWINEKSFQLPFQNEDGEPIADLQQKFRDDDTFNDSLLMNCCISET